MTEQSLKFGKRWSKTENNKLITLVRQGLTTKAIAEALGRTHDATSVKRAILTKGMPKKRKTASGMLSEEKMKLSKANNNDGDIKSMVSDLNIFLEKNNEYGVEVINGNVKVFRHTRKYI